MMKGQIQEQAQNMDAAREAYSTGVSTVKVSRTCVRMPTQIRKGS